MLARAATERKPLAVPIPTRSLTVAALFLLRPRFDAAKLRDERELGLADVLGTQAIRRCGIQVPLQGLLDQVLRCALLLT